MQAWSNTQSEKDLRHRGIVLMAARIATQLQARDGSAAYRTDDVAPKSEEVWNRTAAGTMEAGI